MLKHVPYLDGWRGLAIVCLLLGHFFPVPGINFGTIGVALFFVLSGLLMARVLFIQKTDLATFYRRRISRVIPSVVVYIVTISAIFIALGKPIALEELISAITFTNNYFVTVNWTMPFGHIWSLSVEEHSYIILSIAAIWCRSKGGTGTRALGFIVAVIVAVIAIYSAFPRASPVNFTLRTEVASFGIFISGFFLLATTQHNFRLTRSWVAPIALVIGILCHWWSVPSFVQVIIGWGAIAVSINAMSSAPEIFLRFLEFTWLRKLGTYSFSLYLWQQPYYQLSRHYGMSAWFGLALALITGVVAHHIIEDPARKFLNRQWGKNPPLSEKYEELGP